MTAEQVQLGGLSDEELAVRAQRGAMACFEELVRRFQSPLLRVVLRKTGSRTEAEDVVQDAFVRAFEHLDQYSDRWPFRTWIFTIVHRQAISRHRAARATASAEAMDSTASGRPTPADHAADHDQRQRLWSIARRVLTDEQFAALWMYYVEDMPAPQIARVLERSWVSVKTMLHRARKSLMPLLAGLAADHFGAVPENGAVELACRQERGTTHVCE
ncbi:MAG: sigma-70 family RNA polymerase sigma factor [Tepidisphaeraceae bacterium]